MEFFTLQLASSCLPPRVPDFLLPGCFLSQPDGCWPMTGRRKPLHSCGRLRWLMAESYRPRYKYAEAFCSLPPQTFIHIVKHTICVSFPGREDLRRRKPLSGRSRTNAANEKKSSHLVLHLVESHTVHRPNSNPSVVSPVLTLLSLHGRFVNVLVYYGLSLGVSRLGTNLYLTQFVFGLVEIPARSLVLVVLPISRRFSQSGFLATGGVACLLMLAVPAGVCVRLF